MELLLMLLFYFRYFTGLLNVTSLLLYMITFLQVVAPNSLKWASSNPFGSDYEDFLRLPLPPTTA
mgnify:CR=1 FL=1